jgi:hypothetical protein
MSPTIGELAKALCAAQAKLEPALKNATNPHLKSRYADLASCYAAARDVLCAHGLSIVQLPGFAEHDSVTLHTRLIHTSGEYIGADVGIRLGTVTPQALGSALTYLRRYAYSAAIGLSTADDDGSAASIEPAPPRRVVEQSAPAPVRASGDPSCPICGGAMWDNRPGKADGTRSPKSPDHKCKDKSCSGVIWPGKNSTPKAKPAPIPEPEPGRFDSEEPPPSIDDLF